MKKISLFFASLIGCFFLLTAPVNAQDAEAGSDSTSFWTQKGSLGLNFSNVGLENWAGGGVSSIALGFVGQFTAVRETEQSTWSNQIDLAYGLQKQDGNETFRKTDDQLIIDSQYGYKISKNFSVSSRLNFRTQMDKGYKYSLDANGEEVRTEISKLLAPGYLTLNIGMTYKKSYKNDQGRKGGVNLTFSPLTNKNTFVMDDVLSEAGAFGVDPGKKVRSEFGASFTGGITQEVMENVNFSTNFSLFTNYETLDEIDVNWETLVSMKINDYLNASFGTQLIYDEDVDVERNDGTVGPAVQFKHVLNVGIGFTF